MTVCPREIENNAYAFFWGGGGGKQSIMGDVEVANCTQQRNRLPALISNKELSRYNASLNYSTFMSRDSANLLHINQIPDL